MRDRAAVGASDAGDGLGVAPIGGQLLRDTLGDQVVRTARGALGVERQRGHALVERITAQRQQRIDDVARARAPAREPKARGDAKDKVEQGCPARDFQRQQ